MMPIVYRTQIPPARPPTTCPDKELVDWTMLHECLMLYLVGLDRQPRTWPRLWPKLREINRRWNRIQLSSPKPKQLLWHPLLELRHRQRRIWRDQSATM